MKSILAWFKTHYDKLIAIVMLLGLLASLLHLAGMMGNIKESQRGWDAAMQAEKQDYPTVSNLNVSVYEKAKEEIEAPFLVQPGSNSMFYPEDRVWCVHRDCRKPIPYYADNCPFCDTPNPDPGSRSDYDGDKDGLPDQWETKYGLNPNDPDDASKDMDGDGFSNLEEYNADPQTDPTDKESHPPLEAKIGVVRVKADAFQLKFKGKIELPDGTFKFQINLRANERTFLPKMGEEVGNSGFKVVGFEPRIVEVDDKTVGKVKKDKSILTLQRGEKKIPLELGQDIPYSEQAAELVFAIDKKVYSVKLDSEFELKGGQKYKVIGIDSNKETVVIERLLDNKRFTIRKVPGREAEASSR